mmetsp:Transcript_4932/g.12709  ORF Transcript_4932/g.12709 Transcript_4932/m.12709 type:complete len:216 (-) Transcript_4932:271-918(-)
MGTACCTETATTSRSSCASASFTARRPRGSTRRLARVHDCTSRSVPRRRVSRASTVGCAALARSCRHCPSASQRHTPPSLARRARARYAGSSYASAVRHLKRTTLHPKAQAQLSLCPLRRAQSRVPSDGPRPRGSGASACASFGGRAATCPAMITACSPAAMHTRIRTRSRGAVRLAGRRHCGHGPAQPRATCRPPTDSCASMGGPHRLSSTLRR